MKAGGVSMGPVEGDMTVLRGDLVIMTEDWSMNITGTAQPRAGICLSGSINPYDHTEVIDVYFDGSVYKYFVGRIGTRIIKG